MSEDASKNETRIRRLESDVREDREKLHSRINSLGDQVNASMSKVATTLTRIETTLNESVVKRIDKNEGDIEKNKLILLGDEDTVGIKGQVDRLNQWSGTVKWVMASIAAAVGGLLVQEVWKRFIGG